MTVHTQLAIYAKGIQKKYLNGKKGAGLNGFDLEVKAGTVHGLLGPNGAGKTTAVKIFSTLLLADAGQAKVAGFDVKTQAHQVRQHIGLVGQYASLDEILTGRQNLVLFGELHQLSKKQAERRAEELLTQFRLMDVSEISVSKYSGGMRRRLDLAASLMISPSILFVDEPTTGLDPAGRREVWNSIQSLVDEGLTVLLTTQYLEEADHFADRITLLKDGKVIAENTPKNLKSALGNDRIDITLSNVEQTNKTTAYIKKLVDVELIIDQSRNFISVPVNDRIKSLIEVAAFFSKSDIEPVDISLRRPTLDEVFFQLTGSFEQKEGS